jgi:hypothetical protein
VLSRGVRESVVIGGDIAVTDGATQARSPKDEFHLVESDQCFSRCLFSPAQERGSGARPQ